MWLVGGTSEIEESAGQVVTLRAPAMACEFAIQFPSTEKDRRFAMDAFDWIERLEAQLSVYRDDSEISTINRTASQEPVRVEPGLFRLLTRCRDWHRESEGAFDVTAGPLIKAWGFFRRQGVIPSEPELSEALAHVGMDNVAFDETKRTIQYSKSKMELNLGAVGKGFALDSVGARLKRVGYRRLLLGAGSSSIVAVGSPPWDDAWTVDIRHPKNRERPLALVRLNDAAISTSGVSEQSFVHEGKRYGHVIDPRTGRPVEGMLQATALAGNAAEAEALSTAFFVNGAEWTDAYCKSRPEIGAILLPEAPSGGDLRMSVFGRMREAIVLPEAGT